MSARSSVENNLPLFLQSMASAHDYVATKKELTRLLQQTLTPVLYTRFTQFYNDSIKFSEAQFQQTGKRVTPLDVFLAVLKEVPNWNARCIDHEEDFIKAKASKIYGSYKALWISTLMVISSVRLGANKDINTTVRPFKDFVHEIYIEAAQDIGNDPGLFDHTVPPAQLRKNRREALALISSVIPDAFRNLLPVEEIYSAIGEDMEGQQVFEEKAPEPPSDHKEPEEDELEAIRREAEKIKRHEDPHDSPKPAYGSPPKTPEPSEHGDDEESDSEPEEPKDYGGFTSENDDDDDPYLKDLPADYDAHRRPEAEDDYPDSEEEGY